MNPVIKNPANINPVITNPVIHAPPPSGEGILTPWVNPWINSVVARAFRPSRLCRQARRVGGPARHAFGPAEPRPGPPTTDEQATPSKLFSPPRPASPSTGRLPAGQQKGKETRTKNGSAAPFRSPSWRAGRLLHRPGASHSAAAARRRLCGPLAAVRCPARSFPRSLASAARPSGRASRSCANSVMTLKPALIAVIGSWAFPTSCMPMI